jgi:threonine dehydratase
VNVARPNRRDVEEAAARLRGLIVRTPSIRCENLDEIAGAELWLKAENLQRIGAFKARGAFNNLAQLPPHDRARGVITFSSGNHAQAVALAARHYGVAAHIAMPVDAPAVKVDAVIALGARIVQVGTTSVERRDAALAMREETGGTIIEPFDHPWTIAGQGTATLELLDDVAAATGGETLDALLVPVGGGGLIAGACAAAEGTRVAIHAVEPVGCDSMRRSLEAGRVVSVDPAPTLADGLKPTRVGELCLAVARERVAACHLIDDAAIRRAVIELAMRAKLVAEPSGAAALAIALARALPSGARRIGVIVSGGNVARDTIARLLSAA